MKNIFNIFITLKQYRFKSKNNTMQPDVKVFTPDVLAEIFPDLTVKEVGGKSAHYNSNVQVIQGDQLVKLAEIYQDYQCDIALRRYGKGITIKITPRPDGFLTD